MWFKTIFAWIEVDSYGATLKRTEPNYLLLKPDYMGKKKYLVINTEHKLPCPDELEEVDKINFRITYYLNPKGDYKVIPETKRSKWYTRAIYSLRGHRSFPACFLPEDWEGKRISRKVEVLD
jgi:hypothetical protein